MLSVDGVSETKSTSVSLDVYSLKFNGCKEIYPIKIIRPLGKVTMNHKELFRDVLNDVMANELVIKTIVADNPKRAFLKEVLQHSAKFGCEYCFSCGMPFCATVAEENASIVKKILEQKKEILAQIKQLEERNSADEVQSLQAVITSLENAEKIAKKNRVSTHIVWPSDTMNGEIRTKEKVIEIVEQIEEGNVMSSNDKKGIKGRSVLLDIDYFDYVQSVPTEYMHLVCLGTVKRMLELTFSVGETRTRITKRPLTSPDKFNELIIKVKSTKEFSRRARKLDLAVMKAQELRNLLLFHFPLITKCIESHDKEIKVWEMLAFMVRACILPVQEYNNVNINQIKYCQKNFYINYQQLFGTKNCTYSVHVTASHILFMRAEGPLTETSAFPFEAFYAELRRAFQPGTVSVVKQMFQSVFLKKILAKHVCTPKIYLREKDTALECNSLIYTYVNNEHLIYKIQSIDNNNMICNQMGNHEANFENTPMLNWSSVGVYRKGGLSSENVVIDRSSVAGKVIRVDKYLITCPNSILREK